MVFLALEVVFANIKVCCVGKLAIFLMLSTFGFTQGHICCSSTIFRKNKITEGFCTVDSLESGSSFWEKTELSKDEARKYLENSSNALL